MVKLKNIQTSVNVEAMHIIATKPKINKVLLNLFCTNTADMFCKCCGNLGSSSAITRTTAVVRSIVADITYAKRVPQLKNKFYSIILFCVLSSSQKNCINFKVIPW